LPNRRRKKAKGPSFLAPWDRGIRELHPSKRIK